MIQPYLMIFKRNTVKHKNWGNFLRGYLSRHYTRKFSVIWFQGEIRLDLDDATHENAVRITGPLWGYSTGAVFEFCTFKNTVTFSLVNESKQYEVKDILLQKQPQQPLLECLCGLSFALTWILAWINNYIRYKVWDTVTYRLPNVIEIKMRYPWWG